MGSLITKGVTWRGFKGCAIFALGFYTNDALTPNRKSLAKEAEQTLAQTKAIMAEAKSLREMSRTDLAEVKEMKKLLHNLLEKYKARMAELEIK